MIYLSVILATALVVAGVVIFRLRKKITSDSIFISELAEEISQLKDVGTNYVIDSKMLQDMERLSIVATQTDNAIMIMDAKGNIEWINDGFTRMYEYTFEQFLKIRGDNILKTSFSSAIRERLERCISTKKPVYYEAINVTPSGREIWTHTSLTPILDEQGEVIHLATIDSDISRRKEAGDALVERVNMLSQRINDLSGQQKDLFRIIDHFLDEINEANKKIEKTDMIVNFIRELSDRIRIMGINASIEAHSAGAVGTGFRVLSGEIVKISDETKVQAQKIYAIVDSIRNNSDQLLKKKKSIEETSELYGQAISELRREVSLVEGVASRLN